MTSQNNSSPKQIRKQEADRDVSEKIFRVALSGDEIYMLLAAAGFTTSTVLKLQQRRLVHAPTDINYTVLGDACDKLTSPVELDYKERVKAQIGSMDEALNMGDGVYRP